MKRTILRASLWGVLTLSLFYSCRTDSVTTEQAITSKEKIAAFERFERENNIIKPIASNDQNTSSAKYVSYAYPFAQVIYNFLQNHPDYAKKVENEAGTIRLDVVSQTFGQNKKSVIFPVVNNQGEVVGAWAGILNENRDYVSFYYLDNSSSQNVAATKAAFQAYYDKKYGKITNQAIASVKGINPIALAPLPPPKVPVQTIQEVVINVPAPDLTVSSSWLTGAGGVNYGNTLGGGMSGGPTTHGGGGGGSAPSESAVKDQIKDQPFALIDVPCDIIKKWLETAKFKPEKEQLDKLKSIVDISSSNSSVTPGGITVQRVASLQKIDDAYSPAVNMDYFPVRVNQLPIINGIRSTPEQFLNHIRTNINNFVDKSYSEFTPYNNYGVDDRALWNSSNPLGTIIKIDIKGPDNGSVIVTNYRSNKWTFSTIYEPKYKTHPVSGNRDFGFMQNTDGSYTFYTRGVDRLTTIDATTVQNSEFLSYMMGGSPFSQADALWTSFQNKINNFVNNNQGSSSVAAQEIYRPDWAKVKAVIDGKAPLSSLSKDCGK
ncbi:hypothetical protein [Elizabethkingia meningoseptica]|uniref:hypothetical protein n=1 Tax=Elizabethkingia meningoseptica TaxID=238 RepID=UPI0021A4B64E|nr:hypothetical protein [Elizabethkingia meningoseptica]